MASSYGLIVCYGNSVGLLIFIISQNLTSLVCSIYNVDPHPIAEGTVAQKRNINSPESHNQRNQDTGLSLVDVKVGP